MKRARTLPNLFWHTLGMSLYPGLTGDSEPPSQARPGQYGFFREQTAAVFIQSPVGGVMRRLKDITVGFLVGVTAAEISREVGWPFGRSRVGGRKALSSDHATSARLERGRGRGASRPGEIPARGWKDILVRTGKEFTDDQIPLIAAGCTFYILLALFPGVTAFASLYGLFADLGDAQRHVQEMSAFLPGGAIALIGDQMLKVAAASDGQLSLTFAIGLATALWSANGALKAVISGLNIAYEEKEKRGFLGKIFVPLGFTIGLLLFAMSSIVLAAIGGGVESRFGPSAGMIYDVLYWGMLFVGLTAGMKMLYRFGPSRSLVRWRWITWGSGIASIAWLVMSGLFTFYVANFGSYDASYGALGAVIGFMTWIWLSSMVVLLGAELNSEIEHQTAKDTTTGVPAPLGARGAVMADTIGSTQ